MVEQQSVGILADDSASMQNYYTTQKGLRDKFDIYKSVRNAKWLPLKYKNVTIALEFIGTQLYSIQKCGNSDTHCLRVQKYNRDSIKGVKVDEIK